MTTCRRRRRPKIVLSRSRRRRPRSLRSTLRIQTHIPASSPQSITRARTSGKYPAVTEPAASVLTCWPAPPTPEFHHWAPNINHFLSHCPRLQLLPIVRLSLPLHLRIHHHIHPPASAKTRPSPIALKSPKKPNPLSPPLCWPFLISTLLRVMVVSLTRPVPSHIQLCLPRHTLQRAITAQIRHP